MSQRKIMRGVAVNILTRTRVEIPPCKPALGIHRSAFPHLSMLLVRHRGNCRAARVPARRIRCDRRPDCHPAINSAVGDLSLFGSLRQPAGRAAPIATTRGGHDVARESCLTPAYHKAAYYAGWFNYVRPALVAVPALVSLSRD